MKILTITLLLSVCLCALVTGSWRHASKGRPTPLCCTEVSSVDSSRDIIGDKYGIQTPNGACTDAIILRTNNGKICVDPNAEWVKELIANMTTGNV